MGPRTATRAAAEPGRRAVLGGAVALLALLTTACASSSPRPRSSAPLRFGVLLSVDQLPYFVMRAKGFDTANGLAITESVAQGGTALIEGMAAGSLDVSYPGSVPVLNASRKGTVPGSVIVVGADAFADATHRAFAVVVGSSVTSWSSLAGRDMAVNQAGTIGQAALQLRLRRESVAGVRFVSIPFPNQGLAVAGGNVAGAVMVEPFITQSLLRGDGHVLDWVVGGGEPFPEFEESVIAVSRAFATQHPDSVRAFLRAHLQSVRWIETHEQQARDILSSRLDLTRDVGRTMNLVRFALDARNDAGLLERTRRALAELAPSPAPVAVDQLYDESLLDQVLSGSRSP